VVRGTHDSGFRGNAQTVATTLDKSSNVKQYQRKVLQFKDWFNGKAEFTWWVLGTFQFL